VDELEVSACIFENAKDDRFVSLQNRLDVIENIIQQLNMRGKETEELQEQQRNIEEFKEIATGIKTIMENRAKELEKQKQADETSAGGSQADQEPRRDSKTD
jgi:protoporphyrinogen oxidase